jgi:hypothetical protein
VPSKRGGGSEVEVRTGGRFSFGELQNVQIEKRFE